MLLMSVPYFLDRCGIAYTREVDLPALLGSPASTAGERCCLDPERLVDELGTHVAKRACQHNLDALRALERAPLDETQYSAVKVALRGEEAILSLIASSEAFARMPANEHEHC